MKNILTKINIISFIILALLVCTTLSIVHIIIPNLFHDANVVNMVIEVLLSSNLIFAGVIYIAFSCYSKIVYKSGIKGAFLGMITVVIGSFELININFLGIEFNSSVTLIIIFFMLLAIFFVGIKAVVTLIDNNQKLKQKEQMLRASIAMTKGAQIKSHFVFNTLNAISAMCKYDPEKADEAIVRFSRIMRANMDVIEEDKVIPFTDVIDQLDNYVVLEKIRFGEKFEFKKEIGFSNFKFPLLILQPLIENAIKHGITPKPQRGHIVLKTWKEEDNVYIEIKDDGVGFDLKTLETKQAIGLNNIKFRLGHMVNGDLTIVSEPSKGTKVTITIPYKEDK